MKRATDYDKKLMAVEAISIHALVKRATSVPYSIGKI